MSELILKGLSSVVYWGWKHHKPWKKKPQRTLHHLRKLMHSFAMVSEAYLLTMNYNLDFISQQVNLPDNRSSAPPLNRHLTWVQRHHPSVVSPPTHLQVHLVPRVSCLRGSRDHRHHHHRDHQRQYHRRSLPDHHPRSNTITSLVQRWDLLIVLIPLYSPANRSCHRQLDIHICRLGMSN